MSDKCHSTCMKDAVCIQTDKIYDSCKDKECLENLRVFFGECTQNIIDRATSIRFRDAEILWVTSDIEPVQFNKGFYTVDIKFYFKVEFEVCTGCGKPVYVDGIATYDKKVILFGSEGNAYKFTSSYKPQANDIQEKKKNNLPKAVVETVDPVALSAKLVDVCHERCGDEDEIGCLPDWIADMFEDRLVWGGDKKRVYVTIGIFAIIKLEREVQLLIPCHDFCIPDKECISATDNDPCELFERIKFPVDEFYPPQKGGKDC